MKKLLLLLCLSVSIASAQAVRVDPSPATTIAATSPSSFVKPPILALPFANVSVCQYPANGVPCTNYATTYTDQTEATACPTTSQITLAGTTTCTSTSDGQGNFGFWIPAGLYAYTVTYGGSTHGPYPLTAGYTGAGALSATSVAITGSQFPNLSYLPTPLVAFPGGSGGGDLTPITPVAPFEVSGATVTSPDTSGQPRMVIQNVTTSPAGYNDSPLAADLLLQSREVGSTGPFWNTQPLSVTFVNSRPGSAPAVAAGFNGGQAIYAGVFADANNVGLESMWGWCQDGGSEASGGAYFTGTGCIGAEFDMEDANGIPHPLHAYEGIVVSGTVQPGSPAASGSGGFNVSNDAGYYASGTGIALTYNTAAAILGSDGASMLQIEPDSDNAETSIFRVVPGDSATIKRGMDWSNITCTDACNYLGTYYNPQIVNGIKNGSGFEEFSVCGANCTVTNSLCSTSATAGGFCTTSVITLPVSLVASGAVLTCSGGGPVGTPAGPYLASITNSSFKVEIYAITNAVSTFDAIYCIATTGSNL
ncbi:MAG: hypothetical protein ACRD19_05250 [Terriglobia bacterium]